MNFFKLPDIPLILNGFFAGLITFSKIETLTIRVILFFMLGITMVWYGNLMKNSNKK